MCCARESEQDLRHVRDLCAVKMVNELFGTAGKSKGKWDLN